MDTTTNQPRPNRRYRRLVPAAMTVAALSLSTSGVAQAAAHKPAPPGPAHVRPARPPSAAVVPKVRAGEGDASARVVGV
jgi:hypothetical protein